VVVAGTWNDFEEGTDVEAGITMAVDMEETLPSVLLRSNPFHVNWAPARGPLPVQIYREGALVFDQVRSPGGRFRLPAGPCYEVKVWTSGSSTLSRAVRTRRVDPKVRRR
jgi:hypothetical protein